MEKTIIIGEIGINYAYGIDASKFLDNTQRILSIGKGHCRRTATVRKARIAVLLGRPLVHRIQHNILVVYDHLWAIDCA